MQAPRAEWACDGSINFSLLTGSLRCIGAGSAPVPSTHILGALCASHVHLLALLAPKIDEHFLLLKQPVDLVEQVVKVRRVGCRLRLRLRNGGVILGQLLGFGFCRLLRGRASSALAQPLRRLRLSRTARLQRA
jgi:hypothetical protein